MLAHYDPKREVALTCNDFPYGIGVVLAHQWPNGEQHPTAYASQILADAEHKYAQIEEDGLVVIFGAGKFHQHLYGQEFVIVTNHRPLLELLNKDKAVPPIPSEEFSAGHLFSEHT
eukprot:g26934.t1